MSEHVADLVRTRVVEVLALEQDPHAGLRREPLGVVERARSVRIVAQDRLEGAGELGVRHRLLPGNGELIEGGDEGFRHEPAPEVPEESAVVGLRSEEHTPELQSLMRISYAVFCLNKKTATKHKHKKPHD